MSDYIKLKDVTVFVRNGANIKQTDTNNEGYPITRIETISNGIFNINKCGHASICDETYSDYYLQNNDVLLTHINSEKFIGRSVVFHNFNYGNVIHGMNLLCLRFDLNKYHPEFFSWYMKSSKIREYLDHHIKRAVNQASITSTDIQNMPVPNISLKEQTIISGNLNTLNETVNNLEKQINLLDELVKSRFNEMFGDPNTNPNGYPIKKIEELFDVGSSKRVFESQWTNSGVPFYRAREIVKLSKDGFVDNELFITREMFEEYKAKYGVPQANDMMVTGVGTLGICYIVKDSDEFYFKDGNTLWFKNKGICDVRFVRDQYDTDFVREQIGANANASTVGTYTITNAKNTFVLVPPVQLQKEYVKFVEQIDKSKFILQNEITRVKELISSKLDEYFAEKED